MILVFGATGTTGGAVAHSLAARGCPTRALVRDPRSTAPRERASPPARPLAGIEVITGDATERAAVRLALRGVRSVFLAMANGPTQRDIELGIVEEAARAGVRHIVKLSAPIVGRDVPVAIARMHFEIEQAIEASGMTYTHLRPYAFMQNLLALSPAIRRTDAFATTTGDTPLNHIDARDIADVAVVALTTPGSENRAYVLTGPEALSYPEVARRMTRAFGRPITCVQQTPDALRRELERAVLPRWLVDHLLEIQALAVAFPEQPIDTVAQVTGRPPRTLDAFLREHAPTFRLAPPAGAPRA